MKLQGQHGYAMAALLVGLSIMALLMTAAMPAWRHIAQREKEAELVFRGEQYARAISLYQRKMGPGTMPPNLDVLVEQRYLRKLYKDPITGTDFDIVRQVMGAQPGAPTEGRGGQAAPPTGSAGFGTSASSSSPGGTTALGGIVGVTSKSKAASIRIYNGRTHYNEWQFVSVLQTQAPGGAGAGGARGGPQGQPPNGGFGGGGFGGGGRDGGRGGPSGGPPTSNPFGGRGSSFESGSPFGPGGSTPPPAGGGQSPFRPTPQRD